MSSITAISGEGSPELRVYGYAGQSYTDTLTGDIYAKPDMSQPSTTGWEIKSRGSSGDEQEFMPRDGDGQTSEQSDEFVQNVLTGRIGPSEIKAGEESGFQAALNVPSNSTVLSRSYLGGFVLSPPSGFSLSPHYEVWRMRDGTFRPSISAENYRPQMPTTILYVSALGGSDSNGGTGWSDAFQSLNAALLSTAYTTGVGPAIIYMLAGFYTAALLKEGSTSYVRDTAIIGVGGLVQLSSTTPAGNYAWVAESAPNNNVYSTTTSTGQQVWDYSLLDARGHPIRYSSQSSIAAVQANPGSWYRVSNTLYVHCLDGAEPDTSIRVSNYIDVRNATTGAFNFYFEGLTFEGGRTAFYAPAGSGSTLVFNRCTFRYSQETGIRVYRSGFVFFDHCIATENGHDGFGYINDPDGLEWNCIAYNNGHRVGGNTDNGSTGHDDARIIRLNGVYRLAKDRNIHDIDNVQSWNLGCVAGGARRVTSSTYENSDFVAGRPGENDQTRMWLDSCVSEGHVGQLSCYTGSIIYTTRMAEYLKAGTGGTFEDYTP